MYNVCILGVHPLLRQPGSLTFEFHGQPNTVYIVWIISDWRNTKVVVDERCVTLLRTQHTVQGLWLGRKNEKSCHMQPLFIPD
jgi:hypothetical protein